ncbi:hypothetical protein FQR65_LT20056 [Abscondita terminalis]|nr:hypothetical protein FQR65_LT20056 [Abscondita terminalis]
MYRRREVRIHGGRTITKQTLYPFRLRNIHPVHKQVPIVADRGNGNRMEGKYRELPVESANTYRPTLKAGREHIAGLMRSGHGNRTEQSSVAGGRRPGIHAATRTIFSRAPGITGADVSPPRVPGQPVITGADVSPARVRTAVCWAHTSKACLLCRNNKIAGPTAGCPIGLPTEAMESGMEESIVPEGRPEAVIVPRSGYGL